MKNEVYNCDCMDYMKSLPDNYFSLCIADPPYGIGISSNCFRHLHDTKNWDNSVPNDNFFKELFRVSQNQIIWGGNYFGLPPNRHFIVWDKVQPFDFSSAMCEYAWSSFDKAAKIYRQKVNHDRGKIHPTQKPVGLYAWILKHYANDGDTIFDPMVGSGSSRIAAYQLGFDYIGCEIDKDYFLAQEERFNRFCNGIYIQNDGTKIKQLSLF